MKIMISRELQVTEMYFTSILHSGPGGGSNLEKISDLIQKKLAQ